MSASRLLVIGTAAAISGVLGLPGAAELRMPLATLPAIAQSTITEEEVTNYARAVLEMDQYRTEAYTEIKDLLLLAGADINQVNMSCSGSRNLSSVPRSARREVESILVSYCNQAQEIVEDNGLTSRRFNEITQAHQEDPTVFERIQQKLISLQKD